MNDKVLQILSEISAPDLTDTAQIRQMLKNAQETVQRYLPKSPLRRSNWLSRHCGSDVWLKLDSLNPTGSFKVRGALNAIAMRTLLARDRGDAPPKHWVAASAGNHAQGVAFAAREIGSQAHIFLPKGTPLIKQQQTERLGAQVYVTGQSLDEAFGAALDFAEQTQDAEFIHPFADFHVILGQATCLLECFQDFEQLDGRDAAAIDSFVCAVGGGGLIAGSALAMSAYGRGRVIGVEQEHFDSARASLQEGLWRRRTSDGKTELADGIRVNLIGRQNFEILQHVGFQAEDMRLVSDEDLVSGMTGLFENENLVCEGAGAACVAHMLRHPEAYAGQTVILCLCGGNVDSQVFGRVLSRGLRQSGRVMRLSISMGDSPGQLARALQVFAHSDANLLEVHHDRTYTKASVGDVEVELSLETRDFAHQEQVISFLDEAGYKPRRW